jgi:methylmalonyl-CoA mutase N-terminal domain/subunit
VFLGTAHFSRRAYLAELEQRARREMKKIESLGGSVKCVDAGYFRDQIARVADRHLAIRGERLEAQ